MLSKLSTLAAAIFVTLVGASTWSVAEDALYEAPIPADKSLVRFVNAKLKNGLVVDFSGQKFSVDGKALTAYHIIQNGSYSIGDGITTTDAVLEPGKFYTVAVGAENAGGAPILVIEDKAVDNPSKSALTFYNFASQPADLALALKGDKRTLFEAVAPGGMSSKELPAIDIGLLASSDGEQVLEVESVSLTADKRQNVVVLETSGGITAYLAATELDK
ncbi:alginate O-acetyltransferase AlgF [Roseibium sp. Sym1]|uniref:alginate O-acetyltransferase AlgF n=1 Tax=Roseibium sp. Sym1 TaxID=3016006 RepID=UPI0022B3B302|nr:alginate O-acetyltransferase AlgF [Roseibium sp. Sym1]